MCIDRRVFCLFSAGHPPGKTRPGFLYLVLKHQMHGNPAGTQLPSSGVLKRQSSQFALKSTPNHLAKVLIFLFEHVLIKFSSQSMPNAFLALILY